MSHESKCPFTHAVSSGANNKEWFLGPLNIQMLNQHAARSNPMGENFDYAEAFSTLDLEAVRKDIITLITSSQNTSSLNDESIRLFFIRTVWQSTCTYRQRDGRGGAASSLQRFAPFNRLPNKDSLDQARRLVWPIKQKYGNKLSWADLIVMTANCALESRGIRTLGFAGGRVDSWDAEDNIYRSVNTHDVNNTFTSVQSLHETFKRIAMTDSETTALIAVSQILFNEQGDGRNISDALAYSFSRAWFKLTHRGMGPTSRYLGNLLPSEELIWQDPIPAALYPMIDQQDVSDLKFKVLDTDLTVSELVSTAWASASTYRNSDKRGGANGARIRLEPQKNWPVNQPEQLAKVLTVLQVIRQNFNSAQSDGKKVSIADMIVLAGCAGLEKAALNAGYDIAVPFAAGRSDALQEQTDVDSFNKLEPVTDAFRNYHKQQYIIPSEELMLDRAQLLTLSAPELTVLVGGLRVLNTNIGDSQHGVLTERPETLSTDFFKNLLDTNTKWFAQSEDEQIFEGRDRTTGTIKWTATRVDLVFESTPQLRAIAEMYASADAEERFVKDFIAAWDKIMNLDRFDLL